MSRRLPSVKTLCQIFCLEEAQRVRKLLERGPTQESHNEHPSHGIARLLDEINKSVEGFYGVEGISDCNNPDGGRGEGCQYLNVGDTYALTLIHNDASDHWYVGSWGSFVEGKRRKGVHFA